MVFLVRTGCTVFAFVYFITTILEAQVSTDGHSNRGTGTLSNGVFPEGPPQIKTNGPGPANVFIEYGGKGWTLSELYENTAQWLVVNKHIPDEVRTNVSVWFYPGNTEVMCCFAFHYIKLFGRPVWHVDIGYDGKVKACRQYRATEQLPKGMTIPPPPPDPFLKQELEKQRRTAKDLTNPGRQ